MKNEDFEARFAVFLKEEREKALNKPTGFFGEWAFHVVKRKEFQKLEEKKGGD